LAALLNWMLVPLIEGMISQEQKGSIKHRDGAPHIIELDFYGLDFARRIASPADLFFDMKAAFPSIAHTFVSTVLHKRLGDCPLYRAIVDL
jgi:hypothetical protein